jgi:DnaJ-class molecular chaperone
MAMSDPYSILGVSKTASQDEIKAAYRKLAKQYHPDLNPGKPEIERRFKEMSAAYDVLSDTDKRAKYDRGEMDAAGAERRGGRAGAGGGFWRAWNARGGRAGAAGARAGGRSGPKFSFNEFFDDAEGKDPFDEFLRNPGGGRGPVDDEDERESGGGARAARRSPLDVAYKLRVPFVEATAGIRKRVTLSDGKSIDMRIPPGTENGQTLRLKGQGKKNAEGGSGDALIEIAVDPHDYFRRDGQDIRLDVPVTLDEAVLGGSITVPTVHGNVQVKVPKGSNSGTVLRLRGKGVPARGSLAEGDQYVTLKIMLPDGDDPELAKFVEKWAKGRGYNPRHKMRMA